MKFTQFTLTTGLLLAISSPALAADITVGANFGNVPWEFVDKDNNQVGFEVDLTKEIAKRLDKSVEFQSIPFNGLFSAVQSGRIDIAISSITITPKRLKSVAFAQPYYDSDQSLTTRSKNGVSGLADLDGKIVGVDTGSTGDMWISVREAEYKIKTISRYEGLAPAMLDLQTGRIDAYISDIPALQYYIKDKKQFSIAERIATGEKYSMMFAQNTPLQAEVNTVITELKSEGYIAKIHKKWFGFDAPETSSTVEKREIPTP